jgi:hypothetical protein
MLSVSQKLKTIRHPLISSLSLHKDYHDEEHAEDVLVIETSFSRADDDEDTFDSYLTELLLDLEDLKNQAESCVGKFDRVDIRAH